MHDDQWTKVAKLDLDFFAPKKANFPPQMLTHTTVFRILGGKLSRLKCDLSVLDQSGQVAFQILESKNSVGQSGQVVGY